jgi:Holliday junction resolvase
LPHLFHSFSVVMDNCLNTIKLTAGRDGKNAVLSGWHDAIRHHDEVVIIVEEKMDVADAKTKVYLEKQRVFEVILHSSHTRGPADVG